MAHDAAPGALSTGVGRRPTTRPGREAGAAARRLERRRRVGLALVAYGIAGILLSTAGLLLVVGPIGTLRSVAGQGAAADRWLAAAEAAIGEAEASTSGAAGSLVAAETATRSAEGLFRDLSAAMAGLRDASGLSVLGMQPLAGMTSELDAVARRAGTLASDMATLGGSIASESGSLGRLSADLAGLRAELADARSLLAGEGRRLGDTLGGLVLIAALVAAWLCLPAVASLAIGLDQLRRLRRRAPRPSVHGPAAMNPDRRQP